jgi:hypothetical protein
MPNIRSLSTNHNARLWNPSILPSFSHGQIAQIRTGFNTDPARLGDLDYRTGRAPWLAWGPYLWANETSPREDGLTWQPSDFEADGETLSAQGARKSASLLLRFVLIYRCMSQQAPRKRGQSPAQRWFNCGVAVLYCNSGLNPAVTTAIHD